MRGSFALVLLLACGARTELGAGHVVVSDAGAHDAPVIDVVTEDVLPPIAATCAVKATTALADTPDLADAIAVDAGYVYFHDEKHVWRIPKSGGAAVVVASFQSMGWPYDGAFLLGDTHLAWVEEHGGTSSSVMRAPKEGGTPVLVTTHANGPYYGLTAAPNGDYFFWAGGNLDNSAERVTPSGVVTPLQAVPLDTSALHVDDGVLYAAGEGGISRVEKDGQFHHFASGPLGGGSITFAGFMQFDATTLYFWSSNDVNENHILSVPKSGGPTTTLAYSATHDFTQLVLDGAHLYVGLRFASSVMRMNLDGSSQTIVGTGTDVDQALGVTVDEHCVYWTGGAGKTGSHVYAAPK